MKYIERIGWYFLLMRVKHHIKNLLIFFPLLFAGRITESPILLKTLIGFISFSLVASGLYIINDIRDQEADSKHPIKKNRPIASHQIPIPHAMLLALVLFAVGFGLNMVWNHHLLSWVTLLLYVVINLAYSFGLKNIPLLDILIIASGYLLRILFGSAISAISVSHWMYFTILSLSFYLALGKRRNEISKEGHKTRKVLKYYNETFLDKNMYMCLALSIIFYSLWCVDPFFSQSSRYLIWTLLIVIPLLMRYNLDIEMQGYGDPVDVFFSDKVLIGLVLLLILLLVLIIYLPGRMMNGI